MLLELYLSAAIVFALDRALKAWVCRLPSEGHSVPCSPFRLRVVRNRAGLPGIVPGPILAIAWAVAALQAIMLVQAGGPLDSLVVRCALGAALGGAATNLLDRYVHGAVLDVVDLRIWPVFNLADVAIVLGVAVALWRAA